jgi:hypothetical protein
VLNEHVERLHRLHPATGLSPFQVFGHLARLKQDGLRPVYFKWNRPGSRFLAKRACYRLRLKKPDPVMLVL